jgi:hypothetical protein
MKSNLGMDSQQLLRLMVRQGMLLKQMMQPWLTMLQRQRLSVEHWFEFAVIQTDACVAGRSKEEYEALFQRKLRCENGTPAAIGR